MIIYETFQVLIFGFSFGSCSEAFVCKNLTFPQKFHNRKLVKIIVFYAMIIVIVFLIIGFPFH